MSVCTSTSISVCDCASLLLQIARSTAFLCVELYTGRMDGGPGRLYGVKR